jgi:carboxymethylenebutenolidase
MQYAGFRSSKWGLARFWSQLKKNKVEHTAYFYPVNHGFHNNTTPRYDEAAATLSWTEP